MRIRTVLLVALLFAASNLTVLGGVKFVKTWKNPEAQPGSWKGKKVVAFVSTMMTGNRERAESALARELTRRGAQGIAGNTLVSREVLKDREAVKRILIEAGISGAVIMQVIDVQSDMFVRSTDRASETFASSWEAGFIPPPTLPGNSNLKMNLIAETRIYSLDQDKLLWVGSSKTTDAKEVDKIVMDLVGAVGKELRKADLVSK